MVSSAVMGQSNSLVQILPFVLMLGVFYLVALRPLQRRKREIASAATIKEDIHKHFQEIMRGTPTRGVVEQFFSSVNDALLQLNAKPAFVGDPRVAAIRNEITRMAIQVTAKTSIQPTSVALEIEKLAALREQATISGQEFDAFAERFRLSTGERARSIVAAISDLHEQFRNGAMTEGNYRSTLWSLLDKLDRKT